MERLGARLPAARGGRGRRRPAPAAPRRVRVRLRLRLAPPTAGEERRLGPARRWGARRGEAAARLPHGAGTAGSAAATAPRGHRLGLGRLGGGQGRAGPLRSVPGAGRAAPRRAVPGEGQAPAGRPRARQSERESRRLGGFPLPEQGRGAAGTGASRSPSAACSHRGPAPRRARHHERLRARGGPAQRRRGGPAAGGRAGLGGGQGILRQPGFQETPAGECGRAGGRAGGGGPGGRGLRAGG